MPVITSCPHCARELRLPDTLLGQAVQCPTCSATFPAAAAPVDSSCSFPDAAPPAQPEPHYGGPTSYPAAQQPPDTLVPVGFDGARERQQQLRRRAVAAVAGPGIALMVMSTIDLVANSLVALFSIIVQLSAPRPAAARGPEMAFLSIAPFCVGLVIRFACQTLIFVGALQMTRLQAYGFSMAAAIMATIPGPSACAYSASRLASGP